MAVVGIDLGTTNTVVACVREGRVHVLPDEQGRRLLPSVVSFHPSGEVLVGYPAKERRVVDAPNTIASIKRLIGRAWGSDEIRRGRQRFAFELKEGPGQGPLVVARGQEYTLPEISAFVLRRAKELAERALGEKVDRAVITVPANFNELQRAATKVAGRVAGLDVLRIINEPTAAALAYGLGRSAKERIAIYDFGGGTFDCTLLDLSGNVFEVLATAGDTFLGGDDLDVAIAERMSESFLRTHRYDPRSDTQAFERLRGAAELLKMDLSAHERTQTRLREVAFGVGGAPLDLDFGMTRDDLEMLATPLVERTFAVCQDALSMARLAVSAFDKIILVGGSTRIPLVRRRVEQFFGAVPNDRVNPEEVVAIGAAIQAAALTEVARRRSIPGAPIPAARWSSSPSLPSISSPSDDGEGSEDVTVATELTALMAEREKTRPAAPSVPDGRGPTARLIPPPPSIPAPPKTARMLSVPEPLPERLETTRSYDSVRAPPPARPSAASLPPRTGPLPPKPLRSPGSAQPLVERPSNAQANLPASVPGGLPTPQSFPPPGLAAALVHPTTSQPLAALQPDALPQSPLKAPVQSPPPPSTLTPVLVDVTPHALVVETVGGWCDVVVHRNAKIPCERSRAFATSSDMQTTVRVRVAQGADPTFKLNTYLGEVELVDLRAAPRGQVTILVRFEVDESATLKVFATDSATGRQAHATLQLVGIAGTQTISTMAARNSAARLH